MRRHIWLPSLVVLISVFISSHALAFGVAQGKCLENNVDQKTIKIELYDISAAKIGIKPEPGDILRIAFTQEGDTRKAAKVMNVSKQDLRKK